MVRVKDRQWLQIGAALVVAGVVSTGCSSKPDSAPSDGSKAVVLDKTQVAAALPGADAVPSGWTKAQAPQRDDAAHDAGRKAYGTVGYEAPDVDGTVSFSISSFSGPAAASDHLAFSRTQYDSGVASITVTGADQAFSAHGCLVESLCSASIHAVVGATVVSVDIDVDTQDYRSPDPQILEAVARMQVERVRQIQQGEAPTAKAS